MSSIKSFLVKKLVNNQYLTFSKKIKNLFQCGIVGQRAGNRHNRPSIAGGADFRRRSRNWSGDA